MRNAVQEAVETNEAPPTRATIWREYWMDFDEYADIECPIISIGVSPAGLKVYTILHERSGTYHILEEGMLGLINVF